MLTTPDFDPSILTTSTDRYLVNMIVDMTSSELPDDIINCNEYLGIAEYTIKTAVYNWQDIMKHGTGYTDTYLNVLNLPQDLVALKSAVAYKVVLLMIPYLNLKIKEQEKWDNYSYMNFKNFNWNDFKETVRKRYGAALLLVNSYSLKNTGHKPFSKGSPLDSLPAVQNTSQDYDVGMI